MVGARVSFGWMVLGCWLGVGSGLFAGQGDNLPGPTPQGQGPRVYGPINCTEYEEAAAFFAAAALQDTASFVEFPGGTVMGAQYPRVTFTDGDDTVLVDGDLFFNDTVGIDCTLSCNLTFAAPTFAVGVDFPGALTIDLYDAPGGNLLYSTQDFAGSGAGFFGGVICDVAVGAVELRDWFNDTMFVDDVHFDADAIFFDGFESGDTSFWSSSVP